MRRDDAADLSMPFDEATVRHLCGSVGFTHADALQTAGHVLGPVFSGDTIEARVRGTWHRIDKVTLRIDRHRLQPSCGRHGPVFCKHVGALMLDVLRDPAYVVRTPSDADQHERERGRSPQRLGHTDDQTADHRNELSLLLDQLSVSQMDDLAGRRGVTLRDGARDSIRNQLASSLTTTDSIARALSTLTPLHRLAVGSLYLTSISGPAPTPMIALVFHALGGWGPLPLQDLEEIGLAFVAGMERRNDAEDGPRYLMPHSVMAQIDRVDWFARAAATLAPTRTSITSPEIGIDTLVLLLATEAHAGRLPRHLADETIEHFRTADAPSVGVIGEEGSRRDSTAPSRMLERAARAPITERVNLSDTAIEFAVGLMLHLGVLRPASPLAAHDARLGELLRKPSADIRETLTDAWLDSGCPELLTLVFGPSGPLRIELPSQHWQRPMQDAIADVARLLTSIVRGLPHDVWYDTAPLVELTDTVTHIVTPGVTRFRNWSGDPHAYRIFKRQPTGADTSIVIRDADGWGTLVKAIVDAVLSGPALWLGLVDITRSGDGVTAFRVRLTGRSTDTCTVSVADDLSVFIPSGSISNALDADPDLLSFLGEKTDLVTTSHEGACYRMTAPGAQRMFNEGSDVVDLIARLGRLNRATLPSAAATMVEDWWRRYGSVRLYDDLTVIELNDDLILPELLAATSLGASILRTFSPRIIAVRSDAVESIVADLTARGYAHRVIEES